MGVMKAKQLTIGVDLGATNLRIAAYTAETGILSSVAIPTRVQAGPAAVLDDICEQVRILLDAVGDGHPASIGIGSPGPLELPAGRLHVPPNLPGWDGFPLRRALEDNLQMPVAIDGDANVAALAECALGAGRQLSVDSLCMLTLGTGVGSGIVINGRIFHGATGMAAEAGHLTIDPQGPRCGCGNSGCLETFASATALTGAAAGLTFPGTTDVSHPQIGRDGVLTAGHLAEAARQGDSQARGLFTKTGRALGIGLAALINLLNLPLYVIGGGVSQAWDLFSPALFEELKHRSYVYRLTAAGGAASHGLPNGGMQVIPARLGPEAGLLGACILPLYESPQRRVSGSDSVRAGLT